MSNDKPFEVEYNLMAGFGRTPATTKLIVEEKESKTLFGQEIKPLIIERL